MIQRKEIMILQQKIRFPSDSSLRLDIEVREEINFYKVVKILLK